MVRAPLIPIALFLAISVAHDVNARQQSVAIIGAGYSGMSTAYHLLQKGYKNIVIYESSYRVGGYAASLRHNNVTHDYTIYGMLPTYWRFLSAMRTLGVDFCKLEFDIVNATTRPSQLIKLEDYAQRVIFPKLDNPADGPRLLQEQIAKYAQIWTKLFGVEYIDGDFRTERIFARKPKTKAIRDQLAMTIEQFVEKNGLFMLKDFFIALTDSQAYGTYSTTPAVYHMSWLSPHAFARIEDNTVPCGKYDSFQAIAERLADYLDDRVTFRLGVPVKKVIRQYRGYGATVVEADSGARKSFDRVIVTARLPKTGRRKSIVKPVLFGERQVANTLQELQVYSAVMDGPREGALDVRFSAIDLEAVQRAGNDRWWVVLNCEKRNISNADQYKNYPLTTRAAALFYYDERDAGTKVTDGTAMRERELKKSMGRWDNTKWRIVSSRNNEAYFQRWNSQGVRMGMPWAISDLQGRSGVYYINAGTCGFESVGNVFDCAFHLVEDHF